MQYEVWYRISPSGHWWKYRQEYANNADGEKVANEVACAIEVALKQVGHLFAQATVREERAAPPTPVTLENNRETQEEPDGSDPNDIWQDVYNPPVEVGHGETPPEGYGEVTTLVGCRSCGRGYRREHLHYTSDGRGPFCADCFASDARVKTP